MGIIYKITNKINNKIYIGQTKTPLKERMRKHYSDAVWEKNVTGIDGAIKKYGKENFIVDILKECSDEELDFYEKKYIKKFNTFNTSHGYNLTIGGQKGTTWLGLNEEEVINKYKKLKTIKKTAEYFNCCDKTISNILHKNNIEIKHHGNNNLIKGVELHKKSVKIIELEKEFSSLTECAEWLIENNYSKAKSPDTARNGIRRALKKERDGYCKLHFEYI